MPLISVIVPTKDRLDYLKSCINSLCLQYNNGVEWEIVIVDNGSTDGTDRWARAQQGGTNPVIRYISEPTPGLLAGRHRGAAVAKGKILSFIDDDIEVDSGWLRAICSCFHQNEDIALVGGPSEPAYETRPPSWLEEFWETFPERGRYCTYLSLIDLGDVRFDISPMYIFGLNFSIRRDALIHLGGFHPDGMPNDLIRFRGDGETGLALSAEAQSLRCVYDPDVRVFHKVPSSRMSIDYFERRAYAQGISNSYTSVRRIHGLYPAHVPSSTEIEPIAVQFFRKFVRRTAAYLKRPWLRRTERLSSRRVESEASRRVQAAFDRGFVFHQAEVSRDLILRDWVLRPHYWNYNIPESKQ